MDNDPLTYSVLFFEMDLKNYALDRFGFDERPHRFCNVIKALHYELYLAVLIVFFQNLLLFFCK